jgi:hypothetical protein
MKQIVVIGAALTSFMPAYSQTRVLGWHGDIFRTGWYRTEQTLTPQNVNATSFGKLFTLPADGKVDAQPLYVPALSIAGGTHNVIYVATEHGTVYAYDADTPGDPLWQQSMLQSGETPSDDRNCSQVVPEIGITATPVIDLAVGPNGTMYVIAMSKDNQGNYFHRLHALDITTGAEQFGGPVEVQATYPGSGDNSSNGTVIFDPKQYKERPGLAISNGTVVTSWGSHCDFRPYTGWVITYDEQTLAQRSVLNVTPNGSFGGIWQSGAAPAVDGLGNIFLVVGNGTFDMALDANGFPSQRNFGNAYLKISNNGSLAVEDYFTMSNTAEMSSVDQDFGSGGAMVLVVAKDSAGKLRQLAVAAGKDARVFVIDRNNMGKFNPSSNGIFQELPNLLDGGEFGSPAYYRQNVFFGAVGDSIKCFGFVEGQFQLKSSTANRFGYPGTTPSISSNGSSNAILWALENTNPAILHAYDPMDLSTEFYNSNQAGSRDQFGQGNKFVTPVIANGKVYAATTSGVGVFGLLGP